MPLVANERLGPYEIKSTLGVGGMGEVYRARDTRLNRDVAIKVLREAGSAGAEQRSRFEGEARAIAALSHPNIVAVYDFGVEGGQQYIVSELIEGEPLRSLLTGKPTPVRKLLDIAAQLADGLAAAHAAGIIHRDLKPENIMLTREGRVKILDFGLARRTPPQTGISSSTGQETSGPEEATIQHITRDGAVLGTANYMSPEQAIGKEVDYRTDQFSFGLLLYELASGKQAFARPSTIETMAAIVRDEPAPLERKLPAPLTWIIDRCLAKEPPQRYDSTRDLYHDLRNLRDHFSEAYSSGELVSVNAQKRRWPWQIPALCAACMLFAASLVYLFKPSGQDIGNYRYTPFATGADSAVWSPDGKAVTYAGEVNGTYQVFLRYLNSPVPQQLTHSAYGVQPIGWSSDRSHIIVVADTDKRESPSQKLYSVAVVGGDPDFIMDTDCLACDLSPDGNSYVTIVYHNRTGEPFSLGISSPLGSALKSYTPAPFASKELFNSPQMRFAPDGHSILLWRTGADNKDEGWLLPYPAGGKAPHRILQQLATTQGVPEFSWMPDGRRLVLSFSSNRNAPSHLWMADADLDRLTPLTTGNTNESFPAVAPDGKSLLYQQVTRSFDVVSLSLENGAANTLISSGREETMAAWSANQPKLAWVTNRSGPYEIWVHAGDGSERPAITAADFPDGRNKWLMNPTLSPDGQRLIFQRIDTEGVAKLWMSLLSAGSPVALTTEQPSAEGSGSWSPDGSRFAYVRLDNGRASLMTVRTSGGATPVLLKENISGYLCDWSPAGNWITYHDQKGWHLISPDGKSTKFLGDIETRYLGFAKDGKLLYGIQTSDTDPGRVTLFSLDPATLQQRVIKELGKDFRPAQNFGPSIRFSLAPDGKSFIYSTTRRRIDLWMLQGYRQPSWLDRFHGTFPSTVPAAQ